MSDICLLLIDDESEQSKLLKDALDELNAEDPSYQLSFQLAKTPEDAMIALYKSSFQAIIIDLKLLAEDDVVDNDENLSGNILLKQIIEKEIIPIVVRTGFPEKISDEINKDIVKVYPKEEPLYDIIKELITSYSDSVFKIFGSKGEINKNIKELFWSIIPECFSNNNTEVSSLSFEKRETVIIRYISSWLNNKYMFDEKYIDTDPIEMYMFPNPIEQVCNCDVYEKKDNEICDNYIVLTPSCDLANKKIDEVVLCKIKKYDEIPQFMEALNSYNAETSKESKKAKKLKESLSRWFRNSHTDSIRYHFLPKFSKFPGGFVDFRSIISLKYNKETGNIDDASYKKIGVITESFKRDIVARFSSYYHRQGQPEFNCDSVLKSLL